MNVKYLSVFIFLVFFNRNAFSQCSPEIGPPPPDTSFNTGSNGTGGRLTAGSFDLRWQVSINSISGPYIPATVITPVSAYYSSPWPNCQWISREPSAFQPDENDDYYYKINFSLPCYNSCGKSYSLPNAFCLGLDFFCG